MTKKHKSNKSEDTAYDKDFLEDQVKGNNDFEEGQDPESWEDNEQGETEVLKDQINKEKDNFLRLFAEFENYKKRTSKERIELYSTANKELMTSLIPVLDDFERGLKELEKSSDHALYEGMKLIYNKFKNTLFQKGLKDLEVKPGDIFDADLHEAISQLPAGSEDMKGKIYDVVEKGYKLGDTIIRFPKVVTSN
jgi:molecular chaperone GrpE